MNTRLLLKLYNTDNVIQNKNILEFEIVRYILNGVFATIVHYTALVVNIDLIGFEYIGLANFVAALVGITASFIGNRYFVFKSSKSHIVKQTLFFYLLYFFIALIHGAILFLWSDFYDYDYRIGFVIASIVQFILSFIGNKFIVFKV